MLCRGGEVGEQAAARLEPDKPGILVQVTAIRAVFRFTSDTPTKICGREEMVILSSVLEEGVALLARMPLYEHCTSLTEP